MKQKIFFQKAFVLFICFLSFTTMSSVMESIAAELTPESGIIELARSSTSQTFHGTGNRPHDVAVAPDGSFIVTWSISRTDYPSPVYARYFNADGTHRSDIIQVNDVSQTEERVCHLGPRVAADADGNFVICWVKLSSDQYQLYARLFNSECQPTSGEILISNDYSEGIEVAMDADGDFVVAWNGTILQGDVSIGYKSFQIYIQFFTKGGVARNNDPTLVNSLSDMNSIFIYYASTPALSIDADGNSAIAWSFVSQTSPFFYIVQLVQRFNAEGTSMGQAKKVATFIGTIMSSDWGSFGPPALAMNNTGDFAVSFFYSEFKPSYRFYDNTGIAQSTSTTMGISTYPEYIVSDLDDAGNLIMSWLGCDDATSCYNDKAIYLMQVTNDLSASKNAIRVVKNTPRYSGTGSPDISVPALDASGNGQVVVSWHDNDRLLGRIYTTR